MITDEVRKGVTVVHTEHTTQRETCRTVTTRTEATTVTEEGTCLSTEEGRVAQDRDETIMTNKTTTTLKMRTPTTDHNEAVDTTSEDNFTYLTANFYLLVSSVLYASEDAV